MASLFKRPGGHRWIQFTDIDGKRKTIRLGKIAASNAATVKLRVESLLSSRILGCLPDEDTARWLTAIPPALASKLSAVGLVEKRIATSLDELLQYAEENQVSRSKTDSNEHRHARSHAREFFDTEKPLHRFTRTDGKRFFAWMLDEDNGLGLARSTADKRFGKVKRYFQAAVDNRWITDNPFVDIQTKAKNPRDRDVEIERDIITRILEGIVDPKFRLVVALCRYGGLRTPSEPFSLRWESFDWEAETIRVWAPKTRSWRVIPIFCEMRPYIYDAYELANEGQELVFGDWKPTAQALTSRLKKVQKRLGVTPWKKPWQNMRITRQNELAEHYPEHVVCAWIGNSKEVAREHYLRVSKEHFRRAASGEVKPEAAGSRTERKIARKTTD